MKERFFRRMSCGLDELNELSSPTLVSLRHLRRSAALKKRPKHIEERFLVAGHQDQHRPADITLTQNIMPDRFPCLANRLSF